MRWLKRLGIVVLLLGLVFVGVGLLLPDRVHVARSIEIERPPGEVHALLDGFGRFNEWSPWKDHDPSAQYRFEGPARGVGASMHWSGDKGEGSQRITAIDPGRRIDVALEFGPDGGGTASYLLEPSAGGTRLTWTFDSDFQGKLMFRWIGLFFDRLIGGDYERGLASLKQLAESEPAPQPAPEPEPAATDEADPEDEPAGDDDEAGGVAGAAA
jgi:hypothetical protein